MVGQTIRTIWAGSSADLPVARLHSLPREDPFSELDRMWGVRSECQLFSAESLATNLQPDWSPMLDRFATETVSETRLTKTEFPKTKLMGSNRPQAKFRLKSDSNRIIIDFFNPISAA